MGGVQRARRYNDAAWRTMGTVRKGFWTKGQARSGSGFWPGANAKSDPRPRAVTGSCKITVFSSRFQDPKPLCCHPAIYLLALPLLPDISPSPTSRDGPSFLIATDGNSNALSP
jgi:hypothetical protein